MKQTSKTAKKALSKKFTIVKKRSSAFISAHPMATFFLLLLTLLVLIIAGNLLGKSTPEEPIENTPKQVQVYRVGESAQYVTNAKIEKTGVVTISAQAGGVVSQINVREGQPVRSGQTIVSLASTYKGGNTFSIQRQLAQKQNQIITDNYDANLEIITKQRQLATDASTNTNELRIISESSLNSSRDQLNLNQDILTTIETNLGVLETASQSAANDQLILSTKQLQAQYKSIVNQLQAGIRSGEYQTNTDNPPQKLADNQRELTLKQLAVQEKSLAIQKDISDLQVKLAQVSEGLMYPSSPFTGVVERVLVRPGQQVNPGTPIAVISGNAQTLIAIAQVPQHVAESINKLEPTKFILDGIETLASPYYISTSATAGSLFSVFYDLPDTFANRVNDASYISTAIPIGYKDTTAAAGFVPIDAIYQSSSENIIFTIDNGSATAVPITLGEVIGNQVQVQSGLNTGMEIITNRNIVAGENVVATN